MTVQERTFGLYARRRKQLADWVAKTYVDKKGSIVLFASFEQERSTFRQESSFYYYSGINEPGAVLVIDLDGQTTLYMPNHFHIRSQWLASSINPNKETAALLCVNSIDVLGEKCASYQLHPFFEKNEYIHLLGYFQAMMKEIKTVFTLFPATSLGYADQRNTIRHIASFLPGFENILHDISSYVATMRRVKSSHEIELMTKAIDITVDAQAAAAQSIADGVSEAEVQAALEYIITAHNTRTSFPSIVASGAHSTVLHHQSNEGYMYNGDLVVVDIGAEYEGYAADLTRTYPVAGHFTDRQKELYCVVLETQQYIADLARPGMFLSHADYPEKSLNHLARLFLKDRGYDNYFPHNIGHFLGLDVHDVGNSKEPLSEGDVITIEPGIYIPHERTGIRIEDNYFIVKNGAVCLSEHLPRTVEEIERSMQPNDDHQGHHTDGCCDDLSGVEH